MLYRMSRSLCLYSVVGRQRIRGVMACFKELFRNCDICSRKMHTTCVQIDDLDWKKSLFIILLTEYHLTGNVSNVHGDGYSVDRNMSY
jgi:hypothetical protein